MSKLAHFRRQGIHGHVIEELRSQDGTEKEFVLHDDDGTELGRFQFNISAIKTACARQQLADLFRDDILNKQDASAALTVMAQMVSLFPEAELPPPSLTPSNFAPQGESSETAAPPPETEPVAEPAAEPAPEPPVTEQTPVQPVEPAATPEASTAPEPVPDPVAEVPAASEVPAAEPAAVSAVAEPTQAPPEPPAPETVPAATPEAAEPPPPAEAEEQTPAAE